MKTYIGNERCTRCGGGSGPCPVCNPIEEMAHYHTVKWREPSELSDKELMERVEYLRNAKYLAAWGERLLSKCEAEVTTRKLKRKF